MMHDLLDRALLRQVPDRNARQAAVDLEALDEDGLADELEGGDLLQDTVVRGLVEDDGVLCLVLYFALGPLLLLCGLAAGGWRGCFCGFGLGRGGQLELSGVGGMHPAIVGGWTACDSFPSCRRRF